MQLVFYYLKISNFLLPRLEPFSSLRKMHFNVSNLQKDSCSATEKIAVLVPFPLRTNIAIFSVALQLAKGNYDYEI